MAERSDYDIEYRLADRPVLVAAHGRGVYDEAGNLVRVYGVVRDVTERRQAEDELRDIRSRMETALEAAAIGTWAWDVPNDDAISTTAEQGMGANGARVQRADPRP